MRIGFIISFFLLFPLLLHGQVSLLGGVTTHFQQEEPLTRLDYFGGIEFKVQLHRNLKLYFSPQYNSLKIENHRLRSGTMPAGVLYEFNAMWDERTTLFRFIDAGIGIYGSYLFQATKDEDDITDGFSMMDYGIQVSTKFRIFVFYPLYVSYYYGFANLKEEGASGFQASFLQFGVYIPVSTLLKIY